MEAQITSILNVLQLAERLKFELRHSYTSSGRQESVAEHTWRMSHGPGLNLLKQKVDTAVLFKMIPPLHDLVEAEAKDISVLDVLRNPGSLQKEEKGKASNTKFAENFERHKRSEIYDLFMSLKAKRP